MYDYYVIGKCMEIKRDSYLEQLKLREWNGMIKVITGLRRSGKSYLLFKLFLKYLRKKGVPKDHIIQVVLDDLKNEHLRDKHALFDHISTSIKDKHPYYVLLDEIQLVDGFSDVLNSLLHIDNVDTYVTGSNSKFLSKDILTEFRGRGDEVRVYPLSFSEFIPYFEGSQTRAFSEYMTYGGLPALLPMQTDTQKVNYLQNLFEETYLKDIIDKNRIRRDTELDNLVDILASSVGSLTNPSKLSKTFKSVLQSDITDKTIKTFIDYLLDAFIIDEAKRYDVKGRKYIGSPFKYYYTDVGLRNARLGFRQMEETHLMENIIYNELKYRGYSVDVGIVKVREYSGKEFDDKQLELDFIAYKGNNKYYIQSAFAIPNGEKKYQEERPLTAIKDSFKKIVVVGEDIKPKRDESGLVTIGIYDFLLNSNSLDI